MVSVWWISASDCYVGRGFFGKWLLVFSVKGGRILVHSFVSWEANRISTSFWIHDISLVTLRLTDTNTKNFSFTFIICQSIINQNMIDFGERKRVADRYFSWLVSDTNRTLRFGRSKLFQWLGWWSDTLSFAQTPTQPVVYLLWRPNPL